MSGNIDNDRSLSTGKMFPIDLAPQKITIVKSVTNNDVKMAHLISGQQKASGSSQIITHASAGSSLMRPGIAQIISPSVASQPQMIVSGSPILQGAQIVSQGSQLIGPSTQIISQSQLLTPSGQILSPGTQIISQGTQLSAHVSSSNNTGNIQANVVSSGTGTQLMNVGQLVGGTGNLVVNSSVRTLPSTVRVLPPLPHHNTRPVLSNVNVSNSGVLVSKTVTSHVPRGLAAGASLAVRPVAPTSNTHQVGTQASGPGWGVRGGPTAGPRGPNIAPSHAPIVSLPTTSVLSSASVISGTLRGAPSTTPRPLPLLQRNYHPAKVVGVSGVGVRGVGNSAPPQLYYAPPAHAAPRPNYPHATLATHAATHNTHATQFTNHHLPSTQVNVVNSIPVCSAPAAANQVQPRPSILRKREIEGSRPGACGGWEDVPAGTPGSGGSTTISASSSPAPEDPEPAAQEQDFSPRKKPRKQILTNEVRQCEFPPEEPPRPPSPVAFNPPPKRPQLVSMYVCGWRSTALHFVRPADVRRREPRAKDILAIASQRHVLTSADGWKVHHLTAQMDDLVSLESDVGEQLTTVLKALENASGRALTALQPHTHTLLELLKGNIQRSKIVCEGIQEAREDILRVFTHRNFVSDILTRQADKRCFRKHRSQS